MKYYNLLFVFFIIAFNSSSGQKANNCTKLIIDSGLFDYSKSSLPEFTLVVGNMVRGVYSFDIQDINDVVKIVGGCLNFGVRYGCGCGDYDSYLISDGIAKTDFDSIVYYEVKYVSQNKNDGCLSLCYKKLSYDISSLKFNNPKQTIYIKFVGFDHLIKYE
jgi:hypothetical protein